MSIQDSLPNSRITLRYRTEINGQPEDIKLPLRILTLGDFSNGSSKQNAFDERQIISFDAKNRNINSIMEEMDINLSVTYNETQSHSIPIKNINSFLPSHIIDSIPDLKSMSETKTQLNALVSSINNSSKFRNALKEILGSEKETLESLKKLMELSYKQTAILPEPGKTTDTE